VYKILAVEDSPAILNLIRMSLEDAGYLCVCAEDGVQAADLLEERQFDLVLLDVMLPGIDGFELMDYIRPLGIPVIFLTAKTDVNDKVKGLRLGAEDYLTKPFEILELLARVETVLRRYGKEARLLRFEDVEADTLSRTVRKAGIPVKLTVKEYELLLLFLRNPGIALFRDRIYQLVWGGEYSGDSRTVDLHVQRLRKKLQWEGKLFAVYKIGYRLEGGREREPR
jgi:two-component system alkaline phosphatase synthesis response regulator PhoP